MTLRTIDHIRRDHDRMVGCHPDLVDAVSAIRSVCWTLEDPIRDVKIPHQTCIPPGLDDVALTQIVTNADGVVKKSNHQVKPDGFGHAVDCAFIDDPTTPQPETFEAGQPWDLFGLMAEKKGLTWGGRFVSLADKPHVELPLTH